MQRNSKQVLLKYNTVERKTIKDDALMFKIKTLLRWLLLAVLIFFPFMFFNPFYLVDDGGGGFGSFKKSAGAVTIYGWGLNTSLSVPLYVIPDNDTTIIVASDICSEPLLLLVVVCSAVNNTQERMAIRETWGNFSSRDYKLAFLLGTTDNTTLQETVEEESSIHNDIIQENFIDSYNNLTLKSVMMLKFVKTRCQQVEYIFKSDDDMFVYVPNLLFLVKRVQQKNLENVIIGQIIIGAKPIQKVSSKWYAPKYMFRERVYPQYVSGTGYLMTRKTAFKLYDAALKIPYFHLEDVFVTGLCARKSEVKPVHHPGFTYHTRPMSPCLYIQNQNVITSHKVTAEHMRQLWDMFNTTCPKAKSSSPPKSLLG